MKEINQISEELLYQVKTLGDFSNLTQELNNFSETALLEQLQNDDGKKAFWINVYNSFFQILRKFNKIEKPHIYKGKLIPIAGMDFSLDDIEHGILRKFRFKYSLGYLADPLVPIHIKKLAVEEIDYRIHFALNCGAKSCPPIAFYSTSKIEAQLELATISFLEAETEIDENKKVLHISQLFKWYLADFGGKKGVREILSQKLNRDLSSYKFKFKPYSWEEQLDNYA